MHSTLCSQIPISDSDPICDHTSMIMYNCKKNLSLLLYSSKFHFMLIELRSIFSFNAFCRLTEYRQLIWLQIQMNHQSITVHQWWVNYLYYYRYFITIVISRPKIHFIINYLLWWQELIILGKTSQFHYHWYQLGINIC